MKIFTKALTSGTFTVATENSVLMLSVKATGTDGQCTFQGDGKYGTDPSTAMTIEPGDGLTLSAQNPTSPLDGITITWVAGVVNIIVGMN